MQEKLLKNLCRGLVMRSTGSWYDVLGEDQKIYQGRLRGKLKQDDLKNTNPIAVGDMVLYETEDKTQNTVRIIDIEQRENYIIRQSTHKKWHRHIIAANIDLALIMATLKLPRTSLGFIDRFLVSAESFEIPAIIVFNKSDLMDEKETQQLEELKELYEPLGYQCLNISSLKGQNITYLEKILKSKKTLIAGHSGVGKSTLINRLVPKAAQRTAEVSAFANKGVHTTTFAEMFQLDEDTFLIDTPGIKELGIMGLEEYEVGYFFPEIRAVMGQCKFYNCTHMHEPDCAVLEKIRSGEIALSRYKSYVSILGNEDNRR